MSKARSTGNLNNSIVISDTGAITFVSGSTTLATLNTAGQLSGSTPVVFAATSSFANAFTVAGTLTAQTLVVQTVTSSVSFITGSTRFGSIVSNTHQFTGSMSITGSLSVVTTGTEFQVTSTGVTFGNTLTDSHVISGSVAINPGGLFVSGSGNVGIGTTVMTYPTSGRGYLTLNGSTDTVLEFQNANSLAGYLFQNTSALQIETFGTRSILLSTAGVERMRITSAGNVGIGTSGPNFLLSVSNSSDIWHAAFGDVTSTGKMVRIGGMGGGGTYGVIGAYSGFTNSSAIPLVLQRDGGNVLIGTTTNNGFGLEVNTSIRTSNFSSFNGSVSCPSGTPTTIYTIGSYGLWIIYADLPAGSGSAPNYSAYAIIANDGSGSPRIMHQVNGSLLGLNLSGTSLTATQNSGGLYNVRYVIQKISI